MSGPGVDDGLMSPPTIAPVTVVIPTCRRPVELLRALTSVVEQTVRPAAIVVSDVGGESWALASARAFADRHGLPVTYVVTSAGSPAGATRNRGAADVRSEWIGFLDDDDNWDPGYLAATLPLLTDETDLVATRLRLRHGDRAVDLPPLPATVVAADVLIRNPGITGSNVVVRTTSFHQISGYDETLVAFNDLDFLIRAIDAGLVLRVNQSVLVEQAVHSLDQVTQASTSRVLALQAHTARYRDRMSVGQRITARRERHRMLKHLSSGRAARLAHLMADVALTSPAELLSRARRREALDGGYD